MTDFLITYWEYFSIGFLIYFLPTIISLFNKKSKSLGIFVANLSLGWTVIMWISLFFEAFRDPSISRTGDYDEDDFEDESDIDSIQNSSNINKNKSSVSQSQSRKNYSSSSSSNNSQKINDDRETVEIQFQQTGGNWRTLQVVHNNLDQTISRGMDSVENIISKQSGNTGRVRAKGKRTGTIYDIR